MKLRLNLATSPLEGNRRFAVSAAAAAMVGLAALFLLAGRAYQVWRAETVFRAEQERIRLSAFSRYFKKALEQRTE